MERHVHEPGIARADVDAPSVREARSLLEDLYRAHGTQVTRICRALLRDRAEAEDAAQQVFVSALRALLAGTVPVNGAAWLAAIARHECAARRRRPESLPLGEGILDMRADDPTSVAIHRAELADAWRAIGELPVAQREALLLRAVRGLAYDELAESLQLSRPAVRSLLRRARHTLRSRLERGAAALGGAPWVNALARLCGDSANPAFTNVTKTAAVGIGALAITGGALVAPTVAPQSHAHAVGVRAINATRLRAPSPQVATVVSVPHSPPARRQPRSSGRVLPLLRGHDRTRRDRHDGRRGEEAAATSPSSPGPDGGSQPSAGRTDGGGHDASGSASSGPGDGSASAQSTTAVTTVSSGGGHDAFGGASSGPGDGSVPAPTTTAVTTVSSGGGDGTSGGGGADLSDGSVTSSDGSGGSGSAGVDGGESGPGGGS